MAPMLRSDRRRSNAASSTSVDRHLRVVFQQRPESRPLVPRPHGVALHDPVGVVAASYPRSTSASSTGWLNTSPWLASRLLTHALGKHLQAVEQAVIRRST